MSWLMSVSDPVAEGGNLWVTALARLRTRMSVYGVLPNFGSDGVLLLVCFLWISVCQVNAQRLKVEDIQTGTISTLRGSNGFGLGFEFKGS